jgi:hypothetical protein
MTRRPQSLREASARVHKLTTVYHSRGNGVRVPLIRISGQWLATFGFDEGARYTATGEDGRIVLTVYQPAPRPPASKR